MLDPHDHTILHWVDIRDRATLINHNQSINQTNFYSAKRLRGAGGHGAPVSEWPRSRLSGRLPYATFPPKGICVLPTRTCCTYRGMKSACWPPPAFSPLPVTLHRAWNSLPDSVHQESEHPWTSKIGLWLFLWSKALVISVGHLETAYAPAMACIPLW